jgi:hypothetical protein
MHSNFAPFLVRFYWQKIKNVGAPTFSTARLLRGPIALASKDLLKWNEREKLKQLRSSRYNAPHAES